MRVLIIEDEIKIANSIKKGLEQENFSIDLATDGEIGLDLASTEQYDVIVLDLMLPKIDGINVCKSLRADKIQTPILMLTAKSEISDKILGLNCGADDYLAKPFSFEELLARIRSLVRRPNAYIGNVLSCGTLTLDTQAYVVKRAKKEVELSKTEFALLEFLLRNKEKVMTKEQIISKVWDYDADILENTVEQYVGYLRVKIDKSFPKEKPVIKTIRGFGYKATQE